MIVAIFTKQIISVLQRPDVHVIRNADDFVADGVAGKKLGRDQRDLLSQLRSQIGEIAIEQSRPDGIGLQQIESSGSALQEPAEKRQLFARPFGHGDIADVNACRLTELL